MSQFVNIVEALEYRIAHSPEAVAFRYLTDGETAADTLSFDNFGSVIQRLAEDLKKKSTVGDRALILCRPGMDAPLALYACFLAGIVAVPVPGPQISKIATQAEALVRILNDCQPSIILASPEYFSRKDEFAAASWHLAVPEWVTIDRGAREPYRPCARQLHDVAILQYTSGSTSHPKGVILTHTNLVANQKVVAEVSNRIQQSEWGVSWLPYYHDMGLSFFLQVAYLGGACTLLAPMHFMHRPVRWLEAISRYRPAFTSVPSFALEHTLRRLNGSEPLNLDLSSLRTLIVGAEPVPASAVRNFIRAMGNYGLDPSAVCPCFGMAESTVMITHARHASPVMETFCASGLSRGDVIVEVETSDDRDRSRDITLIGNGCVGDQHAMKIVDPNTRELLDTNKVGEIWVHGPSIGMGYWGNLEASDATFNGRTVPDDGLRYLRTGDLGFVRNGELFVVGRQKEILILNGRNFYPHDVEEIVRNVDPSFRSGMIAVFEDHRDGRAGLGILIEIKLRRDTDIESMLRRMRSAVSNALDVDVHTAGFVSPFALPRTTSGKLRRLQCRELVKSGDLEITSGLEAVS